MTQRTRTSLYIEGWQDQLIRDIATYVGIGKADIAREALRRGLEMLKTDLEADCRNGEETESLLPPGWRESLFRGIRAYNPAGVGNLIPKLQEIPTALATVGK